MYEKITAYINIFDDASISENDLKEKLKSFSDRFHAIRTYEPQRHGGYGGSYVGKQGKSEKRCSFYVCGRCLRLPVRLRPTGRVHSGHFARSGQTGRDT